MGTPDAAPRLRWLFRVLAIIVSSTIALAAAELGARARGHRPRLPATRGPEPPSHVADPTLGWRPAPGRYQFGPYAPGASPVTVTIRADGARETGIAGAEGRPELLLIGCSFTMGWAVSDNETFAARVQSQRPDLEVVNHGVGAYGTLQSLMVLEKLLLEEGRRPAWVLYGYFTHHDVRNIAAPWRMAGMADNERQVATPYCTLSGDGRIIRHPPRRYPSLPLHQHFALVAMLEYALAGAGIDRSLATKRAVTEQLVVEMAALCRRLGVGFSVVLLNVMDLPEPERATRVQDWRDQRVDVIDCNRPFTPELVVEGDGHPNPALHRLWGDCIAAALADPNRLPPQRAE